MWCGTISKRKTLDLIMDSLLMTRRAATGIGLLWSTSRPAASLVGSETINWQTSFYSCTVSHNIICTILIASRLWYHHHKTQKIRASETSPYSSIIAIIVESAALYSLCGIIYIPLVVKMLPAQFAVTALIGALTVRIDSPSVIALPGHVCSYLTCSQSYQTSSSFAWLSEQPQHRRRKGRRLPSTSQPSASRNPRAIHSCRAPQRQTHRLVCRGLPSRYLAATVCGHPKSSLRSFVL